MYLVPVEVKESSIDGKGVFAKDPITQNTIVWQYTEGHDSKMTKEDFSQLEESAKVSLVRVAYLSPTTSMYVMPPEGDPARYTNHNPSSNNISVVIDKAISDEPFFVANRNIKAGEEITNDYLEFDDNSREDRFKWLKPLPTNI